MAEPAAQPGIMIDAIGVMLQRRASFLKSDYTPLQYATFLENECLMLAAHVREIEGTVAAQSRALAALAEELKTGESTTDSEAQSPANK